MVAKMNFSWGDKTNLARHLKTYLRNAIVRIAIVRIGTILLFMLLDKRRSFHVIVFCRRVLEHKGVRI